MREREREKERKSYIWVHVGGLLLPSFEVCVCEREVCVCEREREPHMGEC